MPDYLVIILKFMLKIATVEDIANLIPLVLEFKNVDYSNSDSDFKEDLVDYLNKVMENNLCTILVLYQNDILVGYATLVIYPSLTDIEQNAYLDELFITKEYQNKGLGSVFLSEIKSWCKLKDVSKLKLITRPDNLRAQHFYEKNSGVRKDKVNYSFSL